jgi:hypothetical protein
MSNTMQLASAREMASVPGTGLKGVLSEIMVYDVMQSMYGLSDFKIILTCFGCLRKNFKALRFYWAFGPSMLSVDSQVTQESRRVSFSLAKTGWSRLCW